MFFYVVSRTYAEIFSLLRVCSGLLSDTPGLIISCSWCHIKAPAPCYPMVPLTPYFIFST